jgi:glycosyltransferase involved in cell wall biosynthesis
MTKPHLVWIYTGSLSHTLDAATWLETTREMRRMGWQVTLVASGPQDWQVIHGVRVRCISSPEIYLLRQIIFHIKFLRLLCSRWHTAHVILFHQMSALWILPLRIYRFLTRRKRPLLVMDIRTLHMPPRKKQALKDRLREAFQNLMIRISNFWVDGYLAITPRMAEALRIRPERLWGVWPSGVDLEQFKPAQSLRCWPSPNEPIQLMYIGALHHERNLTSLCLAVQEANAEGMAFQLTLLGDGTQRMELEKFAQMNGNQIRVLQSIPHDLVPQKLAQAHIGVLPFPDEEKFRVSSPIKLFEYMAAGLPILATRIVSHTDVMGTDGYTIWAEEADTYGLLEALRAAWNRRDTLSEMGKCAIEAAETWTWQTSAMKLKLALKTWLERYGILPKDETCLDDPISDHLYEERNIDHSQTASTG